LRVRVYLYPTIATKQNHENQNTIEYYKYFLRYYFSQAQERFSILPTTLSNLKNL
jgi:hypothetical protein